MVQQQNTSLFQMQTEIFTEKICSQTYKNINHCNDALN